MTQIISPGNIEPYDPDKITNECKICKGSGKNKLYKSDCFSCNGLGHYKQTILFRYVDVLVGNSVYLMLQGFATIKGTPTGYWISVGKPKFVSSYTVKRWAYSTQTQALHSYYRRKKAQIQIKKMELERAELALKLTPEHPYSDTPQTFDIFES